LCRSVGRISHLSMSIAWQNRRHRIWSNMSRINRADTATLISLVAGQVAISLIIELRLSPVIVAIISRLQSDMASRILHMLDKSIQLPVEIGENEIYLSTKSRHWLRRVHGNFTLCLVTRTLPALPPLTA